MLKNYVLTFKLSANSLDHNFMRKCYGWIHRKKFLRTFQSILNALNFPKVSLRLIKYLMR